MQGKTALLCTVFCALSLLNLPEGKAGQIEEMHAQAKKLVAEGKLQAALSLQQKALAINPAHVLPHRALSYIYARLGESEMAIKEAQIAINLSPNDPINHYNIATIYQKFAQNDKAVPAYLKAKKLGEKSSDLYQGLAVCLVKTERANEAVRVLEEFLKDNVNDAALLSTLAWVYTQLGDLSGAEETAERALKVNAKDSVALSILFQARSGLGRRQEALSLAERLIAADPQRAADAFKFLMEDALKYNRTDEADSYLQKACQKTPGNADLFFSWGKQFAKKGQLAGEARRLQRQRIWFDLAERSFRQSLTADPNKADFHLALAEILLLEGKSLPEAVAHAEEATRLDPNNQVAKHILRRAKIARSDVAAKIKRWIKQSVAER